MDLNYFLFSTYFGYFFLALPTALLMCLIYYSVFLRNSGLSKRQKMFRSLFVCYISGLVSLTLFLDLLKIFWFYVIYHMDSGIRIRWFAGEFKTVLNFISTFNGERLCNILVFLPYGIMQPLSDSTKRSFKRTVLSGAAMVLCIELLQPILGRQFDVNDIFLNIVGIILSAAMFFALSKNKDSNS